MIKTINRLTFREIVKATRMCKYFQPLVYECRERYKCFNEYPHYVLFVFILLPFNNFTSIYWKHVGVFKGKQHPCHKSFFCFYYFSKVNYFSKVVTFLSLTPCCVCLYDPLNKFHFYVRRHVFPMIYVCKCAFQNYSHLRAVFLPRRALNLVSWAIFHTSMKFVLLALFYDVISPSVHDLWLS